MPAKLRNSNGTAATAAPRNLGITRIVIAQMVGCGVLGWALFAVAVERWIPAHSSHVNPKSESLTRQVSVPKADSISVKSAQFHAHEPDKTR
ncbi:MAG: hypothetical protein JNL67_21405 [Planctomycetaceae bacterium]|nr:hypothetical protein [Planctomycetaceae bacterium]